MLVSVYMYSCTHVCTHTCTYMLRICVHASSTCIDASTCTYYYMHKHTHVHTVHVNMDTVHTCGNSALTGSGIRLCSTIFYENGDNNDNQSEDTEQAHSSYKGIKEWGSSVGGSVFLDLSGYNSVLFHLYRISNRLPVLHHGIPHLALVVSLNVGCEV